MARAPIRWFVILAAAIVVARETAVIAQSSRPATTQKGSLFILVAPNKLHAALEGYVLHKRRQMPAELVSLEDVLSLGTGVDEPERLKRYLYDRWRACGLRYVLLVGDADVLPVRYMVLDRVTTPAFDYAFYPSDLYYADLAKADGVFEGWNAQADGFHARYFGEVRGEKNKGDPINFDGIDYRPEIALGRWPVSTPADVQIVAKKTMDYERALERAESDRRRAAFVAVGGWVDARKTMDGIAGRLPDGWTAEKRYYTDKNDQQSRTPPPDEENVIALLNSGVALVLHAGHGSDHSWEGCLSTGSLKQLRNAGRLPIMLSAGCSTARFASLPPYEAYVDIDGKEHQGTNNGEVFTRPPAPPAPFQTGPHNHTGLGEQLLRAGPNGAVAYFGCNTGSQPCGLTLLEGFVETMRKSSRPPFDRLTTPRLGDCWAGAVSYYVRKEKLAKLKPNNDWYPPSIFFQGMKFMLFGDPTLPLPDAMTP